MKNRLIATVLTLALLCPMLSFILAPAASAALVPNDGISAVPFSDILNEEWNFDDMADGETLTGGYIDSRAKGDFTALKTSTAYGSQPEGWVAVADTENGGSYIYAPSAYLGFEDRAGILLKDTYEVSWRMKVGASTSMTSLLWWSNEEDISVRRSLLRLSNDGSIGYTTGDTYHTQVYTSTKIEIGESAPWYDFRARINPVDGRMWFWLDGTLVVDGIVNEYLRNNAMLSDYSRIGIMYSWEGQTFNVCLDDIKITPVQIDEYIDFEHDYVVPAVDDISEKLDFESFTVGETLSSAHINNVFESDDIKFQITGNGSIVSATDPDNSENKVVYDTNKAMYFVFTHPLCYYESVQFSLDVKFENMGGWTSFLSPYSVTEGEYKKFLRINTEFDELRDNGENKIATLTQGVDAAWYRITTDVVTETGVVTVTVVQRDTGTVLATRTWAHEGFKNVYENGEVLNLKLHQSWDSNFKCYFDNIEINATAANMEAGETVIDVLWDFEDGTLATKGGVTVSGGSTCDFGTVDDDTENSVYRIVKNETAVSHFSPEFTLPGNIYDYETITVSFKTRYDYSSNFTNVFRLIDASGKMTNMFRITGMSSTAGSTASLKLYSDLGTNAGTITQGEWSEISVTINPYLSTYYITVDGVVTYTANSGSNLESIFSGLYDAGKSFSFALYGQYGMTAEVYFDDISIKATAAPAYAEPSVNRQFEDPSFEMIPSVDVANMGTDDWTIATDPKLVAPSGLWDFENKTIAAQNGIAVDQGSNCELVTVSGDSNTSVVLATKSTNGTSATPLHTLPGSIRDYETLTVSFKVKYGTNVRASNYTNLFRYVNADGGYSVIGRLNSFVGGDTREISYRTTASGGGGGSGMKINVGEWNDISFTITPSTGGVVLGVNGASKSFENSAIKALYANDKAFSFMAYYHVNMTAEVYFDDIEIETKYSWEYKSSLGYNNNKVLKTAADDSGNIHGIFAIEDKELYLANQPFEISFDYFLNQLPSPNTGWLNLVKLNMNGTQFTIFRLGPDGTVYNYTSAAYHNSNSGWNAPLNVASKKLAVGQWYNIRMAFDPNTGHVMGYIDNKLVCDYNINEAYVDLNGNSLQITSDPDRMYIEISSQYTAGIKVNDCCIDNLRLRTLNYNEYTKTFISNADFDNTAAGALDANGFAKATGLYTKTLGGSFNVVGESGSGYVEATVAAGEGAAIDMTNGYAPLAVDTVTFEGNFTVSSFGADGSLGIYTLQRDDAAAVSLLSVGADGKLCIGETVTEEVIKAGEIYNIKLVFSGISGTGELYLNDRFIVAAPIIAQADLPTLSYTDALGNTVSVGNKKFLSSQSDAVKTLSGVALQSTVMPNKFMVAYPEDLLNFLSVEGSGTWGVVFDNLSIYRDSAANIYSDNSSASLGFADANSTLWGNDFVTTFNYDNSNTEVTSLVDWTLGSTALSLVKAGAGKLYSADGTTELATLTGDDEISVAVLSNYWERIKENENFQIDVSVYVNGESVGSYTLVNSTDVSSGAIAFASGITDARIYYGATPRDNRTAPDASGVKFEGYNAFSVDFENENFFSNAEANIINYVDWAFPARGSTLVDWEDATVTLAEHLTEGENSFLRIRRPESDKKPSAYMEYNLSAMGEFIDLYSVEMEIRYTENLSSSLDVATLYDENMSGKLVLLSVDYEGKFYFVNNGIRYYLCNNSGENLVANKASDIDFTHVGMVVNNAEGSYSIWIDGQTAWYYADGQEVGEATRANAIPINYVPLDTYAICDAKIRLFECSNNKVSDSVADVDNISIDVIKGGITPVLYGYQISDVGDDIRFIATVDTLFSNSVGFDIVATSNIDGTKTYVDSSDVVFSSIEADGETVTAETLGGRYIVALSITGLKVAEYSFTVTPFIEYYGEKIIGASDVYEYDFTNVSSEE